MIDSPGRISIHFSNQPDFRVRSDLSIAPDFWFNLNPNLACLIAKRIVVLSKVRHDVSS